MFAKKELYFLLMLIDHNVKRLKRRFEPIRANFSQIGRSWFIAQP